MQCSGWPPPSSPPRGVYPGLMATPLGLKTRAWEIAEALWAALVDQRIAYVLPPASFEQEGQKVHFPSDVLDRKVGTCLDLTLLYAACLEQARPADPMIVLAQGHAFVGVWLMDEDFALPIIDDAQTLRKRLGLEEMICVETTLLTGDHPARFRQAVDSGAARLADDSGGRLRDGDRHPPLSAPPNPPDRVRGRGPHGDHCPPWSLVQRSPPSWRTRRPFKRRSTSPIPSRALRIGLSTGSAGSSTSRCATGS